NDSEPAAENRQTSIVAALNAAFARAATELSERTFEAIAAETKGTRPFSETGRQSGRAQVAEGAYPLRF
ncbi:MAG: hypothetical protein ACREGK_02750, partial [Geminicoccales bacterium]